jgi:hypothetical protein
MAQAALDPRFPRLSGPLTSKTLALIRAWPHPSQLRATRPSPWSGLANFSILVNNVQQHLTSFKMLRGDNYVQLITQNFQHYRPLRQVEALYGACSFSLAKGQGVN